MSCRTTAAGSLATTYAQRMFHLEDAQCTSMFHELRRQYRSGMFALPTDRNFNDAIFHMESDIRNSGNWTPGLQSRALTRVNNVLGTGSPSEGEIRFAFVGMRSRARSAREALNQVFGEVAARNNMSLREVEAEYRRLYNLDEWAPGASYTNAVVYDDMPEDIRTKRAIHTLLRGRGRCPACGQFMPRDGAHSCPPGTSTSNAATIDDILARVDTFQGFCDECGEALRAGRNHYCDNEFYNDDSAVCGRCGEEYVPSEGYHLSATELENATRRAIDQVLANRENASRAERIAAHQEEAREALRRLLEDQGMRNEDRGGAVLADWERELLNGVNAENEGEGEAQEVARRSARLNRTRRAQNRATEAAAPAVGLSREAPEPWDMEGFQAVYDVVKARQDAGNTRIPTSRELEAIPGGVTGALGSQEGGNSFGLEIEMRSLPGSAGGTKSAS